VTSAGKVLRIALTGGIASGKSTVADLFARLGVPVIDTDVIARQVVERGQPALARVVAELGPGVLAADGNLDRRRLRELIFAHPDARRKLEAILHPAIRSEMERQSIAAGGPYQVLVIPLLAEGGRRDHVQRVLLVDAPEEVQVERLMRRDGVSRPQALASLAAQANRLQRQAMADDVILNTGDTADLEGRVAELDRTYRQLATILSGCAGNPA
jgi:dephospho-CoA kinase